MKINIKTTNLELTPLIKKSVEEKIAGLSKFIPCKDELVEAFIELALETRHHRKGEIYYAEINIDVPGKIFRAESRKESIYQAVNEAKKEIQRILKKHKEKDIIKKR